MKKHVLTLLVLVITNVAFAVKVGDVTDLMKPTYLQVAEDDLIVVEGSTNSIHVYSLETLKLKHKLGKKGEGPGEFKQKPMISLVSPDCILAFDFTKGIWFSREGKIIKEKVLQNTTFHWIGPIKDNYTALQLFYDRQTGDGGWALVLLDSQFKIIKELTRVDNAVRIESPDEDRSKLKVNLIFPVVLKFTYDDKVFLGNSLKGFYFDVFDHQGNHLYSIDKNDQVEKIKVDDAYKKRLLEYFRIYNRADYESYDSKNFLFSTFLPAFKNFQISEKKIFVITFKEKDGLRELIVLDLKGKILDRLFLPLKSVKFHLAGGKDTYTIYKGVFFELVENEETERWELHKTDLNSILSDN